VSKRNLATVGDLLIADFGVSKKLNAIYPQTSTLTGTPAYMAPEVAFGKGKSYNAMSADSESSLTVTCIDLVVVSI
jgi:serine/threonine protein kinase